MKSGNAAICVLLTLAFLAVPVCSPGQQPTKVFRIGYLGSGLTPTDKTPQSCPTKGDPLWQAFLEGLRERGYIQGQNLAIECRYTEAREQRAATLAAELVRLNLDLLVAHGTSQVAAAKQATGTLPIVMVGVVDPVGRGLVASLAHPGGNVTGPMSPGVEIAGKYVQLLKEAVPTLSRVAVLSYSGTSPVYRREVEAAAQPLDVTLQYHSVREPAELDGAFAAMTQARADALLVQTHTFMSAHIRRIVDLAAKSGLPAVYPLRSHVEAGGLMSYGYDQPDSFRRLGFYVDKIFNGARPADLRVEQPTKFDLVVNLKTANALGLAIPQSLLSRATEVIR